MPIQAEQRQPLARLRLGGRTRDRANPQPERDVLARRPPRQEGIVLEEEADVENGHVQRHASPARRHEAGDGSQDAALAGARRPDQADELAGCDVEIDALDRGLSTVADRKVSNAEH